MGASQPTVSANKVTNNLTTGFKSSTTLNNSYALTLTPALNVSSGYAGSLSSDPTTSLATGVDREPFNNIKKGDVMNWIILIGVGVAGYFIYKKVKK